jgi:uncharacterized membrane-anchored protein
MSLPFRQHPLRETVTAELHLRTFDPLTAPARVVHVASVCGRRGTGRNEAHLARLLRHFDLPLPEHAGQVFLADLGPLRVRWERHTEFVGYTFIAPGPFDEPFAEPLLDRLPQDWLRDIPGEVISVVTLALESRDAPERSLAELQQLFDDHPVIGSQVVNGAARLWTDMRIDARGYNRILLRDDGLSPPQAGRLIKRVLEVNAYRSMALLGLPAARDVTPTLNDADVRLAALAEQMTDQIRSMPEAGSEQVLLAELTSLAAEIENVTAKTTYRIAASQAYYDIVRQRLEQLRQQRIEGLQMVSELLDARLAPGIATCAATAERQQELATRAARLTELLRARVDVGLQEQNRQLLDSMNRRAKLQLRLQETVEGLSVIAIGYYGVGLVGYLIKALKTQGLPIPTDLAIGIAVPLVVGGAWLGLRRMKRRIRGEGQPG